MRRRVAFWALRGLAVVALAAIIGLFALERPVVAPTPTAVWEPSPTWSPPATATLVPTPSATTTPTRSRSPTATQPPSPVATDTPPPTPSATPTTPLTGTAAALASATSTPPEAPTPAGRQLAGRMELREYPSNVSGATGTYSVYLPPPYDHGDRRYPVLYLLHGWPFGDANWDKIGADEVADRMIAEGTLPPLIIVMPWATEDLYIGTSGGAYSFEAQLILDLIPHIDATFRTWGVRDGRAVGGISRGGIWSLEIAFYHPDTFTAVGAHSPALEFNRAPPVYDPFHLLDRPGVDGMRIYLDAGDADWARTDTAALHDAMAAQGLGHVYVVHPGGHTNGLWTASLPEYLTFYASTWPMDGVGP